MEHEKKLAFIAKMTKMGLDHIQHLDSGGALLQGPSSAVDTGIDTNQNNGILGPINSLVGLQNNFRAGSATIQPGTNQTQLNDAYTGANNAINAQTGLVDETRPGVTQGLGAQNTLSQQLTAEANGQGPNPAQAALSQSTGRNVATTASQLAGVRGGSANVGLLARQIGQQGAATQQQAVGQAATLEAQQKLAAQQELQNLATTQVGQGTGAVTTLNQEQQNEQNILQGANTSGNNAAVAMQSNINNANAATAAANQNANANTAGGLMSAFSGASGTSMLSSLGLAKGGLVKMDKGGNVLDAAARKHIAPNNFALPGGRYPIHDISHARNALARVSQNGTPDEKRKVRAAVHKKYPSLAGKKMAEGGDVSEEVTFQPTPSDSSNGPSVSSTPSLPADTTSFAQSMQASGKGGGGGGGGGGSALSLLALLAKGGEVKQGYLCAKKMAIGGYMAPTPLIVDNSSGPHSFVGQWVNSNVTPSYAPNIGAAPSLPANTEKFSEDLKSSKSSSKQTQQSTKTEDGSDLDPGSNLDATSGTLGGGTRFNDNAVDTGTDISAPTDLLAAKGGNVRASNSQEKAKIKGDSLKNDKIPAMLSEGEVVMDRDTLSDPGPVGQMARAVAKHIEKRNKGNKK